jgi:hypothetical protein
MLVRAYDDTDPRLQEEALRRTVSLSRQLDIKVTLDIFAKLKIYQLISFSFLPVKSIPFSSTDCLNVIVVFYV